MKTTLAKLIGKPGHLVRFSNGYVGPITVIRRTIKGARTVEAKHSGESRGIYEASAEVEIISTISAID